MTDQPTEGWVFLSNSRRHWHYVRDGRTLCNKWLYLGSAYEEDSAGPRKPDDCTPCWRARDKERSTWRPE